MHQPSQLHEEPDDESLVWLRQRITHRREMGARLTVIAEDMGVGIMTLRSFLEHEDRRPYPDTWAKYRRWYAREMGAEVAPSELQQKATRALQLFDEGRALLAEVVQAVRQLPATEQQAAQLAAADAPMPAATPNARAASGRRGTSE